MRPPTMNRAGYWRPLAVGGVLLSLLAAACGASTPASSGKFAGQSITYLYFTNGPDLQATKTLIAKFEKQTGGTVTLDTVPYTDLDQEIQAQLSAGKPPAVVQTTEPQLYASQLINLGAALGPSWVHSLNPNLMASVAYKGGYIGLPNQLTVMGAFVNVGMFQKAGVPIPTVSSKWTWSQLIAAAEKVQAANHTTFALAIDHSGDRVANVFAQYGTFLFGSDGHGALATPAATSAMSTLAGLISHNKISKASWIAGGENYVAGDTEFLGQQAPVLLSGSWEVAAFASSASFKWTAVPNPCDVNCGGGSGGNYMVAFRKSNDPALAEAFIKFMSEPVNQAYMSVQSDTIPSAASLAAPGSIKYPATVATSMDVFNKAATLMPAGFSLSEANPGYTAASLALMNELTDVVAGKASVAQAVAATEAAAAAANGKS